MGVSLPANPCRPLEPRLSVRLVSDRSQPSRLVLPPHVVRMLEGTRWGRRRAAELTVEMRDVVLPEGQHGHAEARATGAGRHRAGRIDWFAQVEGSRAALVGEIKRTDWDAMRPDRVVPNARRHGRQLWRYLDSPEVAAVGQEWVQLFVEYPRWPETPGRGRIIEDVLADFGVTVAWVRDDERYPEDSGPSEAAP